MSQDICYADATELAEKIRSKTLSPVEVMRAHLERIEAINAKINAVVTLADDALEQAQKAEDAIARGEIHGPLHGVPFTAKDCFDSQGLRTTRGSLIFADLVPATDSTAVRRLKEAGGILIGKTNLPEFALRAETFNKVFDRTLNPWNLERTPGGSSGGEAAAISAGLSPLGIGTDLGGSNRLPSHYCGIVGFKPTHGRIPLTGSWPELMCRHMHVGPTPGPCATRPWRFQCCPARTTRIPTRYRRQCRCRKPWEAK
jgi:aspartyl-tRNA(Asn)/glutamyl-tRNA(Gln) amidotransferase subunit A